MKCSYTSKGNIKVVIDRAECATLNRVLNVALRCEALTDQEVRFARELRWVPILPAKSK